MVESDWAIGGGALDSILRQGVEEFLRKLTQVHKPALIVPCMVYYPCVPGQGWSDQILDYLGYTESPEKVQAIMRMAFRRYTSNIVVGDVQLLPMGLYNALDANDLRDYDNRVEPSVRGGVKMAAFLLDGMKECIGEEVKKEPSAADKESSKEKDEATQKECEPRQQMDGAKKEGREREEESKERGREVEKGFLEISQRYL
tara:strand:- start:203 stop:805 length:603 start_codon:yes stop_codon:yes gene_type:complete